MKAVTKTGSTIEFSLEERAYYPWTFGGKQEDSMTLVVYNTTSLKKNRYYHFYLSFYQPTWREYKRITLAVVRNDDESLSLKVATDHRWNNSQDWWFTKINSIEINPGWITVDGVDVYTYTKECVDIDNSAALNARKNAFDDAKKAALELGVTEERFYKFVGNAQKKQKLNFATGLPILLGKGFSIEQILAFPASTYESFATMENYCRLIKVAGSISADRAQKAATKAYAWAYLLQMLPEVTFAGYFWEAKTALEAALESSIFKQKIEVKNFGSHQNVPAVQRLGDIMKNLTLVSC